MVKMDWLTARSVHFPSASAPGVLFRFEVPPLQYADLGISCQFLFLQKDCISFSLHLLGHVSVISVWLRQCLPHAEMHSGTLSALAMFAFGACIHADLGYA